MMTQKKRTGITLSLALACGVAAAFGALQYLQDQTPALSATQAPSGRIAVAARDLPVGAVLRAEDVRIIEWPGGSRIPAGYIAAVSEAVGRGVLTPLVANEPILSAKLAGSQAGGGMQILIPEGMRAVSVKVDEVIGVAGFVLPDARVDVMVTLEEDGRDADSRVTRVILQNIRTLAAGQSIHRDGEGEPQTVSVVTLLVSPEDGEKLVLAANEGRIQLALRNTLDLAERSTDGARASSLIRGAPAARPTRRAPVTPSGSRAGSSNTVVETIRGGQRTLSTFSGAQ